MLWTGAEGSHRNPASANTRSIFLRRPLCVSMSYLLCLTYLSFLPRDPQTLVATLNGFCCSRAVKAKVTVFATVKPRMYIHFPDLDPEGTGKPEELQIGYCYMPGREVDAGPGVGHVRTDAGGAAAGMVREGRPSLEASRSTGSPESEIVRPLKVRNVSDRKLYLTCIPNLRKQCFVYTEMPSTLARPSASPSSPGDDDHRRDPAQSSDDSCRGSIGVLSTAVGSITTGSGRSSPGKALAGAAGATAARSPVKDLLLLPQSMATLYVGLRPVLPGEAYITGYGVLLVERCFFSMICWRST